METYEPDTVRRDGLAVAHTLERLITEFIADVRAWAGLQVYDQRDPGGRIVSYGYHWHEPDDDGFCGNLIVYGYPTPLAAVNAGFKARSGHAHSAAGAANRVHIDHDVERCKVQ